MLHRVMPRTIPYAPDEVGERIRILRVAFGFKTQAAFAEHIGAKRGEVAAWESGGRRPSIEKAEPIVERFRVTLDWLFLGNSAKLDHDVATLLADTRVALSPEDLD